ncbi:hypothetical protein BC834DRAFT_175728 [Gloeopeniophorella convolvens]|nr:hypothetical protein BC834DRAFT_175728 [Gloeopeniophorella convolvens]
MTETAAPNSPLHLMPHSANDTVLLEVFDVYRVHVLWKHQWKHQHWFKLAHVCRRWRELVLSSPSRLHLCLYCTQGTHAADLINHFPTLPLILDYSDYNDHSGGDGIRYALKHVSRARKVWLQSRDVETVLATFTGMKQPAEELEDLRLELAPRNGPIVIKSFLGGHAPRLRRFHLSRLIFSPLPVLLSPMPNLVSLKLNVFSSTVIRPAELLVQLSAMLRLENLYLHFFPAAENDAPVDSDGVAPSPRTRILLAELSEFTFTGHSNWLEAFVDGMEPGAISNLTIRFYDEPLLRTPHLGQFVARSEVLRPTAFHLSMHNETIAFSAPNDDLPSRIVYSNPPTTTPRWRRTA